MRLLTHPATASGIWENANEQAACRCRRYRPLLIRGLCDSASAKVRTNKSVVYARLRRGALGRVSIMFRLVAELAHVPEGPPEVRIA
jgi:hypothetical protein